MGRHRSPIWIVALLTAALTLPLTVAEAGSSCTAKAPLAVGPVVVAGKAGPVMAPVVGGPKCATQPRMCIGAPCTLRATGTAESGTGGAGVTVYLQRRVLSVGWTTVGQTSCRAGWRTTHNRSCSTSVSTLGHPGTAFRAVCVWKNGGAVAIDRNTKITCNLS